MTELRDRGREPKKGRVKQLHDWLCRSKDIIEISLKGLELLLVGIGLGAITVSILIIDSKTHHRQVEIMEQQRELQETLNRVLAEKTDAGIVAAPLQQLGCSNEETFQI